MIGTAAAILLCLLPTQVNALTALAICLSGYEWMFSSIGQSPCDVTVEVAQVCYSVPFQLTPLTETYYTGPWLGYDSSCLCNSVYYSLLSACAYCQGRGIRPWTDHSSNCTRVYLSYPHQIPPIVKVPAYAFQDVTVGNIFNVTLASLNRGVESSRTLPSSTTFTSIPSSSPATTSSGTSSSGSNTTTSALGVANARVVSPGTVGGVVVGGLVGVGLIAALITFLVLRSKQKSRALQQTPNMAFSPYTASSLNDAGKAYNPNDPSTYPSDDPYRQHSPLISTPQFTGNGSAQNHTMQQNTGGARGYSGIPEL